MNPAPWKFGATPIFVYSLRLTPFGHARVALDHSLQDKGVCFVLCARSPNRPHERIPISS